MKELLDSDTLGDKKCYAAQRFHEKKFFYLIFSFFS